MAVRPRAIFNGNPEVMTAPESSEREWQVRQPQLTNCLQAVGSRNEKAVGHGMKS